MENKVSVWKANLNNGLILGSIGIVYSLVMYFLDLSFNKTQGYVFYLVLIIAMYFLLKSYRDNYMDGYITYGQSVGAGMVIFIYYSLITALFIYLLYAVIDPGLTEKQLVFVEEEMLKKGIQQDALDAAMTIQKKIIKPGIMAPFSILGNIITGLVLSLLVSIFIRKEGNPLIESPENN
ncbi:MAG TPA: DUF4199 domain-containing protein [Bacteroidales bacterium]|nr:DUF4199 family protein [Bacteroidales bacterium]HNR41430.1 DUF4199 domain-containing protein [Bacteroidales bacterium]